MDQHVLGSVMFDPNFQITEGQIQDVDDTNEMPDSSMMVRDGECLMQNLRIPNQCVVARYLLFVLCTLQESQLWEGFSDSSESWSSIILVERSKRTVAARCPYFPFFCSLTGLRGSVIPEPLMDVLSTETEGTIELLYIQLYAPNRGGGGKTQKGGHVNRGELSFPFQQSFQRRRKLELLGAARTRNAKRGGQSQVDSGALFALTLVSNPSGGNHGAELVSLSPRTLLEFDMSDNQDTAAKKKVFICPKPSCLHHHPCHAFGDLVGIKKHFRREHSDNKQWAQTDSTATPSLDASFSLSSLLVPESTRALELHLLPSSSAHSRRNLDEKYSTHLKLSIGSNSNELSIIEANKWDNSEVTMLEEEATRLKELATKQLKLAMAEKAYAEKGRQEEKMVGGDSNPTHSSRSPIPGINRKTVATAWRLYWGQRKLESPGLMSRLRSNHDIARTPGNSVFAPLLLSGRRLCDEMNPSVKPDKIFRAKFNFTTKDIGLQTTQVQLHDEGTAGCQQTTSQFQSQFQLHNEGYWTPDNASSTSRRRDRWLSINISQFQSQFQLHNEGYWTPDNASSTSRRRDHWLSITNFSISESISTSQRRILDSRQRKFNFTTKGPLVVNKHFSISESISTSQRRILDSRQRKFNFTTKGPLVVNNQLLNLRANFNFTAKDIGLQTTQRRILDSRQRKFNFTTKGPLVVNKQLPNFRANFDFSAKDLGPKTTQAQLHDEGAADCQQNFIQSGCTLSLLPLLLLTYRPSWFRDSRAVNGRRGEPRSRIGFIIPKNTAGIRHVCVRDLQLRVPTRPEPSNASKKAQEGSTAITSSGFALSVAKATPVEIFIEHQDICIVRRVQPQFQAQTDSTATPSLDASFSLSSLLVPESTRALELHLLPSSSAHSRRNLDEKYSTHLKLSIGSNSNELSIIEANKWDNSEVTMLEEEATRLKELATKQLKLAMAEKAYAEKGRQEEKVVLL
ncbi:hypothetical protein F3Y22_tig00004035pilonHSYRG00028 [Hibiscus syriacus]|uniref:BIRD-IDD transcription factor second C2H2 zinc finger domain-containing protein n=1 Tax=Hibiscus syriacus TaxID=106335 RepID=A0A6A3CKC9_HIBSY|nr:hypothetical protein F3Y22_tig00004035pilonHSYRG00028 [Hibiscus syriacus]